MTKTLPSTVKYLRRFLEGFRKPPKSMVTCAIVVKTSASTSVFGAIARIPWALSRWLNVDSNVGRRPAGCCEILGTKPLAMIDSDKRMVASRLIVDDTIVAFILCYYVCFSLSLLSENEFMTGCEKWSPMRSCSDGKHPGRWEEFWSTKSFVDDGWCVHDRIRESYSYKTLSLSTSSLLDWSHLPLGLGNTSESRNMPKNLWSLFIPQTILRPPKSPLSFHCTNFFEVVKWVKRPSVARKKHLFSFCCSSMSLFDAEIDK